VLSELIERWPGEVPDDRSFERFAELRDDIEKIKTRGIVRALSELAEMKQRNPDEYARLAPKLREILEAGSDKSR
jgi:DNA-binding HxlR family transcriptional regulator